MADAALKARHARNCAPQPRRDGIVYLQVTRGAAPRDFAFPEELRPSLVVTARRKKPPDPAAHQRGRAMSSRSPISAGRGPTSNRWRSCPMCSRKQRAKEAGAYEAWQVDRDGNVTEGTSTNAWIVTAEDES